MIRTESIVVAFVTALVVACSSTTRSEGPFSGAETGNGGDAGGGTGGDAGGGSGVDSGAGGTGGDDAAAPRSCSTASDCPILPHDARCAAPACTGGACGFTFVAKGTTYGGGQTPGDCRERVCDGAGGVQQAPDPSDVPPQVAGDCRVAQCDASGNVTQQIDDTDLPASPSQCAPTTCKSGAVTSTTEPAGTPCTQQGGRTCDGSGACKYCPVPDAACTDIDPGEPNNGTQATAYDYGTISNDDNAGKHECGIVKSSDVDWFTFTGYAPTFLGVDMYATDPAVLVLTAAPVDACIYIAATTSEFACPSGTTPDTAPDGHPGCCKTLGNNGFTVKSPDERRVWIKIQAHGAATCLPYDLSFHD